RARRAGDGGASDSRAERGPYERLRPHRHTCRLSRLGSPTLSVWLQMKDKFKLLFVARATEAVRKLVQEGSCHSGTACKAGPGNHEHLLSQVFTGLCSWVPGSRAVPAPRKDIVFEFPATTSKAGVQGLPLARTGATARSCALDSRFHG